MVHTTHCCAVFGARNLYKKNLVQETMSEVSCTSFLTVCHHHKLPRCTVAHTHTHTEHENARTHPAWYKHADLSAWSTTTTTTTMSLASIILITQIIIRHWALHDDTSQHDRTSTIRTCTHNQQRYHIYAVADNAQTNHLHIDTQYITCFFTPLEWWILYRTWNSRITLG